MTAGKTDSALEPKQKKRGPLIPAPAALPEALDDVKKKPKPAPEVKERSQAVAKAKEQPKAVVEVKGKPKAVEKPVSGVPEAADIVKDQSQMRKKMRDEAKAAAAAKEVEKEKKKQEKIAKEEKKEERKRAKQAKDDAKEAAKKARTDMKEPAASASHEAKAKPNKASVKLPETDEHTGPAVKPSRKRQSPAGDDGAPPTRKPRRTSIMSTPVKVWNPHGTPAKKNQSAGSGKGSGSQDKKDAENPPGSSKAEEGTPKKVKARRKREEKAQQAMLKIQRQKQLLPEDLEDLKECEDLNKMTLVIYSTENYVLMMCCFNLHCSFVFTCFNFDMLLHRFQYI